MSSSAPADPEADIRERLALYRPRIAALEGRDARIAHLRLLTFVALLALGFAAVTSDAIGAAWMALPAAVFAVLVVLHGRVLDALADGRRRLAYHEASLGRMAHALPPAEAPEAPHAAPDHPYAADLDLFGPQGLFALICTTRSRIGEHTLAQWLLTPASAQIIPQRQRAAAELAPKLQLREDLACLGSELRMTLHPTTLTRWAAAAAQLPAGTWRLAAFLCNAAVIAGAAAWNQGWAGPGPFLAAAAVGWGLMRVLRDPVDAVMAALQQPRRELADLAEILSRLEAEPFTSPQLQRLQGCLRGQGQTASDAIGRLGRLADLWDAQKNQLFAPIAILLLWSPHLAWAVEGWRRQHGPRLPQWLEALGELEALCALGGYAFEHPRNVFPEVSAEAPRFEATGLGHPLLLEPVRNDVSLTPEGRLLLVSGSNMSGKSTLLRSVGTNAVLALAGAPVCATRLRLSVLAVGATLRVQDSLQSGTSRFYAEIRRLQLLRDIAAGPTPLLFLLDEILHGTNSHDRAVGATAVLQGLLERGAIGCVTTHDLALTQLAIELGFGAVNVHFEDDLKDGKLHFDYRMRPGVVQKSNALALMRAVGLYD
jgi:hypothetical protein